MKLEHSRNQAWYRYTSLFAESLQFLAKQRLPEAEIANLFELASGWFQSNGLYEEAIESALSARRFERALALIESYIEMRDLGELRTLSRWLENIPADLLLHSPALCFAYAQIILYTGDRFAPSTAARLEPSSACRRVCMERRRECSTSRPIAFVSRHAHVVAG